MRHPAAKAPGHSFWSTIACGGKGAGREALKRRSAAVRVLLSLRRLQGRRARGEGSLIILHQLPALRPVGPALPAALRPQPARGAAPQRGAPGRAGSARQPRRRTHRPALLIERRPPLPASLGADDAPSAAVGSGALGADAVVCCPAGWRGVDEARP